MMKKNNIKHLLAITFIFAVRTLTAQNANELIKEGNAKYDKQDYDGARENYQEAVKASPESVEGNFNLGNSLYMQQQYDAAAEQFSKAAEGTKDPEIRSQAYHNLGNTLLEKKDYSGSIDAYKKSLRDKPEDADTKYNLSYAQQMLKKQQQQQQQKQDQQKQQQQQQQKQKQQQQDNNPQNNNQDKQPEPNTPDKKDLDRILKSLNEDDKAVQDKVNKQKARPAGGDPEKDW